MTERSRHNETIVDQHTQQAEGYAALTKSMAGDRRAPLRDMIAVRKDDRLLDIACGPGSLTLDLAPHIESATGLDITPAMLNQARAAQAERGIDNVSWVSGDAAALPFADGAFSIVTSSAAFHHFDAPARVLSEMVRVCRAGGRVVVIDVTPDAEKAAAYDRLERMRDPSHNHAHSVAELTDMARRLGLPDPAVQTSRTGPIPFRAILDTSFPERHTRAELYETMRQDAAKGTDDLGFNAWLDGDELFVSYPMSMLVWTRPE